MELKEKAVLVSENDFSKTFKCGDIELYVAKAENKDDGTHHVVCSIPIIEELNVLKIQMPFDFNSESHRDWFFNGFDADKFLEELIKHIIENAKAKLDEK